MSDRSLLVKLAMPLKKEIVVQALSEDLLLSAAHKQLLLEHTSLYQEALCPEGLEILFSSQQRGGELFLKIGSGGEGGGGARLRRFGLAQDFFWQFFRTHDPVSAEARGELLAFLPAVFQPPPHADSHANNARVSPANPPASTLGTPGGSAGSSRGARTLRHVRAHLNSLLLRRRPASGWAARWWLSAFLVAYFCLLIVLSLPPRLLLRTRLRAVQKTLQRTLSRSATSLANLSRSASADLKMYFKY
eukprot:gene7278-9020_t